MDRELGALLRGELAAFRREPDGSVRVDAPRPAALLPGSFNPLHDGHTVLAAVASKILGVPIAFELSVSNVDKPDLNADEVTRRLAAFRDVAPVWVTRAATFARKAELFPGCAFAVGFDTAIRLIDAKYYGGDESRRDACLRNLVECGCRVLVGGRRIGEEFRVWDGAELRSEYRELFATLAESDFRVDRTSTELRAK